MRKIIFTTIICLICVLSIGCGKSEDISTEALSNTESTSEIVSTPIPTPTEEPNVFIMGEEVTAKEIEEGYTFTLFGKEVNTKTTERLEYLKQEEIGDEGLETFREVLPYLKGLTYLSFDRCGTTDEAVASLRDDFPNIKIAWRVFFSPFSCMTDTEKIWASCDLTDAVSEPLKYCTDVKYLDIGHNAIKDISFVEYMPNLEAFIVSCSEIEDISPIANHEKLIFFECAESYLRDCSPLATMPQLEYINIGCNPNMPPDFDWLFDLENPKRIFIQNYYDTSIDMSLLAEELEEKFPDCEVDVSWNGMSALSAEWKFSRGFMSGEYVPMYRWIREIFEYDNPYGSTRLYE